jgi:hypothetical protein
MEELVLFLLGLGAFAIVFIAPIVNYFRLKRIEEKQQDAFASLRGELFRLQKKLGELTAPGEPASAGGAAAGDASAGGVKATQPQPTPAPTEPEIILTPQEPTPPPAEVPTPPIKLPDHLFGEPAPHVAAASLSSVEPAPPHSQRPTFEPLPPREPSRFEVAARETLHKIWNWIIVGEEHVPAGMSMEYAIASQWLLRIGVLIGLFLVGYFLNYSIENGWLGPQARVTLSTVTGLVLIIAGTRILGKKYHVMGQGLMGGGLATLYFSVFAAANMYKLIPTLPAFALMAAITVLAGGIAVRFNSMLVAVLGIIGGYGTPLMFSTVEADFVGLFGYMLVLGIGVLGICYWKNWPLVNYLSFFATYGMFFASMRAYTPEHFTEVMPFLVAFFVLFSTMTFLYKVFRGDKSNLLDLLALFINAGVFFVVGAQLIDQIYERRWVAVLTLGLVVFYTAHIYVFLRRKLVDRDLLVSLFGLSAFFLAITMPLVLSRQWLTASWAIQAVVLLWIAQKIGSQFVRHIAFLLFGVVLARFCFYDLGRQFSGGFATAADMPLGDYVRALAERAVTFGIPIASFAIAYRMLGAQPAVEQGVVTRENDVQPWLGKSPTLHALIFASFVMGFLYLHLELNRTIGVFYPPIRLPVLTLLWIALCGFFLFEYSRTKAVLFLGLLGLALIAVVGKLIAVDLPSWGINERLLYMQPYSFRDAAMRLIDFGAIIGFFGGAYAIFAKHESTDQLRRALGFTSLAMLFIYLTLEVNSYLFHNYPGLRAGGVSVLWAIFALALVWRGMSHKVAALRYLGLALFVVVTGKVFFNDLANTTQFWRMVALVPLVILFLAGSFLYLKYNENTATAAKPEEKV